MKKAKYIALGITVILAYGWFTSTRHLDYTYLIEGEPLSGCVVTVLDAATGETQFTLNESGSIRFPARFEGKTLGVRISRDDEILRTFLSLGLSRGEHEINYLGSSTVTTFNYRFLWFSKTEQNESWDLIPADEDKI